MRAAPAKQAQQGFKILTSVLDKLMNPGLDALLRRLEIADREHQSRLNSDIRQTKTNRWIRRQYLAHRSFSHANDARQAADGASLAERAWLAWTTLRWKIEIAL